MRFRAAALLLAAGAAFAQTAASPPQSDNPVIRVDVREVMVPVIVTDQKGHHVTGLKSSDFRLEEDGVEQKITGFSTDTAPEPKALASFNDVSESPAATNGSSTKALRHTFVICFDTLHSSPANAGAAREALVRLFEKEKGANALYSIVAVGRQLQVLEAATGDPGAVLARVRSAAFQNRLSGADALGAGAELDDLKNYMYDFCRRCPVCTAHAGSSYHSCDSDILALKTRLDEQAQRWKAMTGQMLEQIKAVVEELAKLPTARTLVLVSDGFSLQPARDFYAVAGAFIPADPHFKTAGQEDLQPALQSVIQSAVAGNVRIYSVDSRGVAQPSFAANGSMDASAPSDRSAPSVIRHTPNSNRGGTLLSDMDRGASTVAFENGSAMEQAARSTGGVYFHDSNDMLKQFRSVLADGHEYYLLTYAPNNAAQDGSFRTITVEVVGRKLSVRAKAGYWAKAAGQ